MSHSRAEGEEPLDVCLLTTGFPRCEGDLFGAFVLELARALQRQGLRVGVLAPHDRGAARQERVDGVRVWRFRYFVPRWQRLAYGGGMPTNLRRSWLARAQVPLFLAAFCLRAVGLARRSRVLHCHWIASGLVGWLATRLVRRPVVLTVRGSDFHLAASAVGRRANRFLCARMAAVLAVSADLAQRLVAAGTPADRVQVVENGVDGRFCPGDRAQARRQLGLPPEGTIALFVGLLVPVKGLDTLLDALARMADRGCRLVLVGEGPSRAPLEAQAAALGLLARVRFAGQRPAGEIPRWLVAANLLVLPSLSEGRPNVVLEAHACGLPVVATAVGGTPELVTHGEDGLLVPAADAVALAAALDELVADGERRRALGAAGRRRILASGLTWAASAQKTRAVYDRVAGAGAS